MSDSGSWFLGQFLLVFFFFPGSTGVAEACAVIVRWLVGRYQQPVMQLCSSPPGGTDRVTLFQKAEFGVCLARMLSFVRCAQKLKREVVRLLSRYWAPGFVGSSWQAEKLRTLEYGAEVKWRILRSFYLSTLRLVFPSCTAQYGLNVPYSQRFCPE